MEPPFTSVFPSEKTGHPDSIHLCMLLGIACWGQRGAWFLQRPSIQRMLSCATPLSPKVTSKQKPRGNLLPHTRATGSCGPLSPPYSTSKPSSPGQTGSAEIGSAHPNLRLKQPRQQLNSYRGVAGPSRPRLGWCPLLPLPGVRAVQLVATLVTGATGWTKNNLGTNQHPGNRY